MTSIQNRYLVSVMAAMAVVLTAVCSACAEQEPSKIITPIGGQTIAI
jgi:hypothetical protein